MPRPIHILHVFSSFGIGGPQVRFASLTHHLGYEFTHTVVAVDGNYNAVSRLSPETRVETLPAPSKSAMAGVSGYVRLLRDLRPDLLQTYNWGAVNALAAGLLLRSCPLVHHEHGFGPDEAQTLIRRRVLARSILLRHVYINILPSQTLVDIFLNRYRLPPAKVLRIANGVDTGRLSPSRNPGLRQELGLDPGAIVVGTVGGFRGEKRLEFLIRAFSAAAIPNAVLLLVGDGERAESLRALAASLSLGNRVRFLPHMVDTAPLYGVIDIYAMSSITEQMPMALLEAMSSGLPAVCTAAGDTAYILGQEDRIQVHALHDQAGYVEALRRLAADVALRQSLGAANRRRCMAEYSLDVMVAGYRNVYLGAIASRSG